MEIGNGFKVSSVVIYPDFGQVNGEYIRDVPLSGAGNSTTFNLSVEEARSLIPGTTYKVTVVPEAEPQSLIETT